MRSPRHLRRREKPSYRTLESTRVRVRGRKRNINALPNHYREREGKNVPAELIS